MVATVEISSLLPAKPPVSSVQADAAYLWRNCRCRRTLVPVNRQHGGADRRGTRTPGVAIGGNYGVLGCGPDSDRRGACRGP